MESKLLIDEYPLIILPKLAAAIGLNEAIMLQQVHYWVETFKKTKDAHHFQDGEWWVWNTGAEWQENFPFWSERTVWRVIDSLRGECMSFDKHVTRGPLIITGNYNRKAYDKTLWYRIDYAELERIEKSLLPTCQYGSCHSVNMDHDKLATPIPETTTETITEKNPATVVAIPPLQEQKPNGDIETFFDGAVPEEPATKARPAPEKKDAVLDIAQQAGRRASPVVSWLLPGVYCGDHDYLEPYKVFCAIIQREPVTVGEKKTCQWLAELERIAQNDGGYTIPPGVMAQAIKAIRDDWNFEHKRWRTPYHSGFAELVELTAAQIAMGTGAQPNGWSTSL